MNAITLINEQCEQGQGFPVLVPESVNSGTVPESVNSGTVPELLPREFKTIDEQADAWANEISQEFESTKCHLSTYSTLNEVATLIVKTMSKPAMFDYSNRERLRGRISKVFTDLRQAIAKQALIDRANGLGEPAILIRAESSWPFDWCNIHQSPSFRIVNLESLSFTVKNGKSPIPAPLIETKPANSGTVPETKPANSGTVPETKPAEWQGALTIRHLRMENRELRDDLGAAKGRAEEARVAERKSAKVAETLRSELELAMTRIRELEKMLTEVKAPKRAKKSA